MSKHRTHLTALSLCALLAGACDDDDDIDEVQFPNEVDVRMSDEADFASYETFAVVDRSEVPDEFIEGLSDDDLTKVEQMNDAARDELLDMGLTEVDPGENPDLQVFSLSYTTEEAALTWDCVAGYWRGYWDWDYDPCRWLEREYEDVDVRTLVTGLVDPNMEEVVFVGFVQGVEDIGLEPDDVIVDSVDAIYDEYP